MNYTAELEQLEERFRELVRQAEQQAEEHQVLSWILAALAGVSLLICIFTCVSRCLSNWLRVFVEDIFDDVLGVETDIEEFVINPLTGKLEIRGFRLANPPGYVEPYAFHMKDLKILIDVPTLICSCFSTVCIEQFRLIDAEVVMEAHGDPFESGPNGLTSNLHELLDRVTVHEERHKVEKYKPPEKPGCCQKAPSHSNMKLQLHNVDVEGVSAKLTSPFFEVLLEVEDVKSGNVTKDHENLDMKEVALFLLKEVFESLVKSFVDNLGNIADPRHWCKCAVPEKAPQ